MSTKQTKRMDCAYVSCSLKKSFTSKMERRIFRGYDISLILTYPSEGPGGRKMIREYRFVLLIWDSGLGYSTRMSSFR